MNPAMRIVHADADVRAALAGDLTERFGAGYDIAAFADGESLAAALGEDAAAGRRVAVVLSDESPDGGSARMLGRAHALHPRARRIVLIGRGEWSREHPAVAAMRSGQADSYIFVPWGPRERWLYLPVSELLADWEALEPPAYVAAHIVGGEFEARAYRLRDMLSRIGVPAAFSPPDSDEGRRILERHRLDAGRLPVLAFRRGTAIVDPSHERLAVALGFPTEPELTECDVVIVGAGPAGLAAAVYAASEGLSTSVIEPVMPGGQAGTSSRIRNYLGFPNGVSGRDLAIRAFEQAWFFGARFVLSKRAVGLRTSGERHRVEIEGGAAIGAGAVVLATGVTWHRLGVPSIEELLGAGVYYGASVYETSAAGARVVIVGGGNSTGQAAVHLAREAASVMLVVRGPRLGASMSDYLVRELDETPNVEVLLNTRVVAAAGAGRLERLTLEGSRDGARRQVDADALYVMIGARPETGWLDGAVARDEQGYVLTGRDVTAAPGAGWPLERAPMLMETSRPGIFATGDVRHGSVRRVASAVGGGSIAVQLVHLRLAEID
jgi:thioredoxin reductase (NADPH)